MEKPLNPDVTHSGDNIISSAYFAQRKASVEPGSDEVSYRLTVEAGKNFFMYIKKFNLNRDKNIFILPPSNHYYYDKRELKQVRTLLSLRKLNLINDIESFLDNLFIMLPANANFLGCFTDSKAALKRNGFLSDLSARVNNLLDMRLVHYIDKNALSEILEKHGFKVVDMAEIDNLTYFYSQRVCQPQQNNKFSPGSYSI